MAGSTQRGIIMMDDQEAKEIIGKIDKLSEKLGLDNLKTKNLLQIKKTENPDNKTLELTQGDWNWDEPMFAIDEEDSKKVYTFVPVETLNSIMSLLKTTQQENFDLKLEKTIWQHIPADFDDVWVVAMDEIKKEAQKSNGNKVVNINLNALINKIKKEHPNLFLDIRAFYQNNNH